MKQPVNKVIFPCIYILSLIMISSFARAQGRADCKVRLDALSGQYHGNCKNGVAQGYGVAVGEDTYKGQFKNGLPHGQGTYIWSNGNKYEGEWKEGKRHGQGTMTYAQQRKDSVVTGLWKNGQLANELEQKSYEVTSKEGVDRVRIYKIGEREIIEIFLKRHGSSKEIRNLRVNTSSGTKNTRSQPYTIEFPKFPYNCSILFEAPSKLQTYYKNCEVEFEINEPGRWKVEITY